MTKPATASLPLDDDPMPMPMGERVTWAFAVLALFAGIGYFGVVLPRLADTAVGQIEWQVPMLIAIAVTVVGTILVTIVSAIVAAIMTRDAEQGSDIRDTQITQLGNRINLTISGIGFAFAIALAMLDVDQFYIGSALFAVGLIGGIGASIAKIRAYRVTFDG